MSNVSKKVRYTSPDGSPFWEYVAATSCCLMVFTIGCIAGWNSPTLAILMGPKTLVPLTASDASTLSAMMSLGHALAPTLMMMPDKLGRRNSILVTGVPLILGWGLIAVSQRTMVLLVARFLGGLAIGLICALPPMYLGEIASPKFRGAIGMVCSTTFNAGILCMFLIVPYLSVGTTALICLGVAVAAVVSVWFIPESPYYLAMIGRNDEAKDELEKLRGKTDVSDELELIKMTVNERGEIGKDRSVFKKLFTVRGNRKALFVCVLFSAVLQFGGCVTIMIYGDIIFAEMNAPVSTHVCMLILATVQLVCNILTTFVIEKLGRRPLLCVSGSASGVCLLAVAVYFYLMDYTEVDVAPYGVLALCAVVGNIVALNVGLVPLQMVIQSEILATDVKGLANCVMGLCSGTMSIVAVKFYLTLALTWGYGHSVPFFGFALITWSGASVMLKLLPETKGKTLYEIQKDLNA